MYDMYVHVCHCLYSFCLFLGSFFVFLFHDWAEDHNHDFLSDTRHLGARVV